MADLLKRYRDWAVPVGLTLVLMALFVTLAITGAHNPTPTNTNSGGTGSMYPHTHQPAAYTKPIGGDGPQSS